MQPWWEKDTSLKNINKSCLSQNFERYRNSHAWLVKHSTENAFLEFLITLKYLQIIYLKTLI